METEVFFNLTTDISIFKSLWKPIENLTSYMEFLEWFVESYITIDCGILHGLKNCYLFPPKITEIV